MLNAISIAGAMLRENPDLELADRLADSAGGDAAGSTETSAFIGILNGSLGHGEADESVIDFPGSGKRTDACGSVEFRFAQTLQDLERPETERHQIIGDGEGPVLLRKIARGIHSALSLKPIRIEGIPYPPGSILHIELEGHDIDESDDAEGVEVIDLGDLKGLGFTRLSSFAFGPEERRDDFPYLMPSDDSAGDLARSASMEDVLGMVEQAYELVLAA